MIDETNTQEEVVDSISDDLYVKFIDVLDIIPDDRVPPTPDKDKMRELRAIQAVDLDCDDLIDEDDIEKPRHDFESRLWGKIEEFEAEAFAEHKRGLNIHLDKIDKAINGLRTGVHIIGGDSNHGKSAVLTSIELGLLQKNDNIFLMSFSLDDNFDDKISRFGALLSNMPINFVNNPQRTLLINPDNTEDPFYKRWKNCITRLKMLSNKLSVYDAAFGTCVEDILKEVLNTLITLQELEAKTGVKKQLVLTIDNFHDLESNDGYKNKDECPKYIYIIKELDKFATTHKIPIIVTAELKKSEGNGNRRPVIKDIREAYKIAYKAKSVMLVYNEVSVKGDGAQIYWSKPGDTVKRPVIEVHFAKNKHGEYKGRTYFLFQPELVKVTQASDEMQRKFHSKLYG